MFKYDIVDVTPNTYFKVIPLLNGRNECTPERLSYHTSVSRTLESAVISALLHTPVCDLPAGDTLISFNVFTFEGRGKVVTPINYERACPTSNATGLSLYMMGEGVKPVLLGMSTYKASINESMRYMDPKVQFISGVEL